MNRTKNRKGGGWRHIAPKSEYYTLTADFERGVYYWKQSNDFYQTGWPMPPILLELCELLNKSFGLEGEDRINSIMIIINEGGTPIENDGFTEPFAHCAPLHMDKHRNGFFFDLSLGYAREMVLTSTDAAHKVDGEETIYTESKSAKVANYVVGRQRLASASLAYISQPDNKVYKHGVRAEPEQPLNEPRFSIVARVKTRHPGGRMQGEHFAPVDPVAAARVLPGGDLWKEFVPRFKGVAGGVGGSTALDPIHHVGYVLIRNAIPVDPAQATAIRNSNFDDADGGLPNENFKRDGTRLQTKSTKHEWCRTLSAQQAEVLRRHRLLATSDCREKLVVKMRALKSVPTDGYDESSTAPQTGDQGEHTDESVERMSKMEDQDKPLATLYAIERGTRLRIRSLNGEWEIITLEPGDLLVFRGDACHNGLGYAHQNIRVHAYVHPQGFKSTSELHGCSSC